MRQSERVVLYSLSVGAIVLSLMAGGGSVITGSRAVAGVESQAADSSAAPGAEKIAVVSLMKITDELMDSDRYKPKREELDASLNKDLIRPAIEALQDLEKKLQGMDEKSPEFPQMRNDYVRLRNELGGKQREAAQKAELLVGEQLKECFQLVRDSAAAIAEKKGYTYVLSSMRPDDKFQEGPVQATIRDVLSRPVLAFPKAADITEDVREDLKL
jgi:Skp family chaperone for outer membrane proteins